MAVLLPIGTRKGLFLVRTDDGGKSWESSEELGLPEDGELKLNATWHLEPGADSELWLGGDPGVLFRSDDGGRTVPERGRRRELDADQQERRGRVHAGSVSGGRAVRPQAPRASRATGAA